MIKKKVHFYTNVVLSEDGQQDFIVTFSFPSKDAEPYNLFDVQRYLFDNTWIIDDSNRCYRTSTVTEFYIMEGGKV